LPFRPVQAIAEDDGDASRELAYALGIDREEALWPLWDWDSAEQQGWSLANDKEGARHWRSSARGVSNEAQRGWRFQGRIRALERIVSWLDRLRPDHKVLVVTGSPGAGKSAVLGRVVVTADSDVRAELPTDDTGVLASLGLVDCAVYAKGKNALDVAKEIARAACAEAPGEPADLAAKVRDALVGRGSRFNVIIDGLDEMSPHEAREVIDHVVLALARNGADAGVQVVVGARRRDDHGDLLERFGPTADVLDLDNPEYFEQRDLAAYAQACLQMDGDDDNPFADPTAAGSLASRIAQVSGKNFLIAALIAKSWSEHPESADPGQLTVPQTVRSALERYLQPLASVTGVHTPVPELPAYEVVKVPAAQLLTALAFAESPGGLPTELWQLAVKELYRVNVAVEDLAEFTHSAAANFLVQTTETAAVGSSDLATTPTYQLYHQALGETLLHARADAHQRVNDERKLTNAFITFGRAGGWQDAFGYLLRSLPAHASRAGLVDNLLTESTYLLYADLYSMIRVSGQSGSPFARMLRLTPRAFHEKSSAERAAMFSVTEALDQLGTTYQDGDRQAPYCARWAVTEPRTEHASFESHQGIVYSICTVNVDGRELLASGGSDATVRLWDPQNGEQIAVLDGHPGGSSGPIATGVGALCAVTVDGRSLLATGGGSDRTVRLQDPNTSQQVAVFDGHHGGWIHALCTVSVDGRELLASCDGHEKVQLWDPRTGQQHSMLDHNGNVEVHSVCAVVLEGRDLLASGGKDGEDGMVRLWDPCTGRQHSALQVHNGFVYAMATVKVDGRDLLAFGGHDGPVRLWDPRADRQHSLLDNHGSVDSLCAVTVDGRTMLASGGYDGPVRLWDPQNGEQFAMLGSHEGRAAALCAVTVDGRTMLASGGGTDGTVRLWDPEGAGRRRAFDGHKGGVPAVCGVTVDGRNLLASGGYDGTVLLWDPQNGEHLAMSPPGFHAHSVTCVHEVIDGT